VVIDFKNATALAIGAHPDDIEYGCGGILQRLFNPSGLIVTDGTAGGSHERRLFEMQNSAVAIGYRLHMLFMPDRNVNTNLLIDKIEWLVERIMPDVVLVHHEDDFHQDHRAVTQATLSALRGWAGTILFYRTPSTRSNFEPNLFVELSQSEWKRKVESIQIHQSQAHRSYLSDDALRSAFHFWSDQYRQTNGPCEPFFVFRAVISMKGE
jgi:LmbE family N-acetylglucosaminyl deacetylase